MTFSSDSRAENQRTRTITDDVIRAVASVRAGAIALIGAGAAVGALALNVHIGLGMALSAVITIVVTVIGHLARSRD